MSRNYGGNAVAHNQYCKITQWIAHHKDHGDPKYAEAVSDLCLDSWLSPSRYPGLTFLYQTNKKLRKEFGEKVFTKESRDACEEFKRYILPDIFETCEDFQKKDVGNVLGYKYDIKSCDKHKVVFENGMEIHPLLSHNSYEPLNPKLRDIIRIYYVVKGEPDESGDPYKIPRSMHKNNRSSGHVSGGGPKLFRDLFLTNLWKQSHFKDILLATLNLGNTYKALTRVLEYLKNLSNTDPDISAAINNLIKGQTYIYSTPVGIITYIYYTILLALLIPDDIPGSREIFVGVLEIIFEEIIEKKDTVYSITIIEERKEYIGKLNLVTSNKFSIGIHPLSEIGVEKIIKYTDTLSTPDTLSSPALAAAAAAAAGGGSSSILGHDQSILLDQMFSLLYDGSLWVKNPRIDKIGDYDGTMIAECLFTLNVASHEIFLNNKESPPRFKLSRKAGFITTEIITKLFEDILADIEKGEHFSKNGLTKIVNLLSKNSRVLILAMGHERACENFINRFWSSLPQSGAGLSQGGAPKKILNKFLNKDGGNIMNNTTVRRGGGNMESYF
jgi:hypothetical protein